MIRARAVPIREARSQPDKNSRIEFIVTSGIMFKYKIEVVIVCTRFSISILGFLKQCVFGFKWCCKEEETAALSLFLSKKV